MSNLSSTLSHLLSKAGLTTSELARKTGVAQPVIHRLMSGATGNPQIMTLKPLADYFEITLEQIMGFKTLGEPQAIDSNKLRNIYSTLATIKAVAITLTDLMPTLEEGYKAAIKADLVEQNMPTEILPLLLLNIKNLLKHADFIKATLMSTESTDP